jgi:hypothetical protein
VSGAAQRWVTATGFREGEETLSNLTIDARDGGSWGHVELAVDLASQVLVEQHLEFPVLCLFGARQSGWHAVERKVKGAKGESSRRKCPIRQSSVC